MGHQVGKQKVSELLHELDYSLQSLRKTSEGSSHPGSQRPVRTYQSASWTRRFRPRASPSSRWILKKKELDRRLSQQGKGVAACGRARAGARTRLHRSQARQGAIPYGTSMTWRATKVGSTSASATTPPNSPVESIRRWWYREHGPLRVPRGHRTPSLTADGGGCGNGYRNPTLETQAHEKFAD